MSYGVGRHGHYSGAGPVLPPWVCRVCKTEHPLDSLARDCETKHEKGQDQ